jgi:hypothetical protein
MSFYSTLRVFSDEPTRAAILAMKPAFLEMIADSYHSDVADDFMQAFSSGESSIKVAVPAVQELVEWVHHENPSLRFCVEVCDDDDGDFEDWSRSYGITPSETTDAILSPSPKVQRRERLKLILATLLAVAGVAFFVLRQTQAL